MVPPLQKFYGFLTEQANVRLILFFSSSIFFSRPFSVSFRRPFSVFFRRWFVRSLFVVGSTGHHPYPKHIRQNLSPTGALPHPPQYYSRLHIYRFCVERKRENNYTNWLRIYATSRN